MDPLIFAAESELFIGSVMAYDIHLQTCFSERADDLPSSRLGLLSHH
jgi:hypothetical protein